MTDPTTTASKTERLDEALACVRKYGRQTAADTRAIESAIRDLRTRIDSRARELEPAEA
ncbi:hypothetical protein [Rhodovibrio sodomensis]|uniref:hypothetical protein n=1 Tax=Rhodovibrio sodomensis TaxID=1088 RepID=UPI001905BB0C|nr:hypothetical protein [Rhodovibrio sodomensis]